MTTTDPRTYILRYVDLDGEVGYDDPQDWGHPVIESAGQWIATLDAEIVTLSAEAVEREVAAALDIADWRVTAIPTGPNISGDTSTRNLATTSDQWTITVLPDANGGAHR